jgi:hypothetical protein
MAAGLKTARCWQSAQIHSLEQMLRLAGQSSAIRSRCLLEFRKRARRGAHSVIASERRKVRKKIAQKITNSQSI